VQGHGAPGGPVSGHRFTAELRARMAANLAAFPRASLDDEALRRAAVAVTIVGDAEGRACFVLTRRASRLARHAGQWALPGGRVDPDETPEDAALRELDEEIGLRRPRGDVLGLLDDYPTRSGFLITPVVVWGTPTPAVAPHAAEVASVHLIPLDELERPEVPRFLRGIEPGRPIIQVPLLGRHVHAPTAAILYQAREVALHGRAARVAHFDQPAFAWR
jgi:8-oxo-dGTP pyrophosphatase MutT (NUDIX family)